MTQLKKYISKQLDTLLEEDKSKRNPSVVASKLKSLGITDKAVKKAVNRMKSMGAHEVEDDFSGEDLFPGRIHSDDEIKDIITIRKLLKGKSPKLVDNNLNKEKEIFINHYDNLFSNGASELPGILELYSLFKTKRTRPNIGKGHLFKMLPEDAKKYAKDIVKYFLVKNSDVFPMSTRAKISLDAYLNLLEISKVEQSYIDKTRNFYYEKYNLNKKG
jgi:hypothetical protein